MEPSSATHISSKTPPPPPPPYPPPPREPPPEHAEGFVPSPRRPLLQDGKAKAQDGHELEIFDLPHARLGSKPQAISVSFGQGLTEPELPMAANARMEEEADKLQTPHAQRQEHAQRLERDIGGLTHKLTGLEETVGNHAERLLGGTIGFHAKSFTPDEQLRLCRRASIIHFEMMLMPTVMVQRWISPELQAFYKEHTPMHQRCWVLLATAFIACMPWAYGNSVMRGSCSAEEHTVYWRERSAGNVKESAGLQKEDCYLEQRMKSLEGILWGLYLVGTAIGLMVLLSLITRTMQWCAKRADKAGNIPSRNWWLNAKRIMWRPLLLLWYYRLNIKMPAVKYANEGNIIPGLYTRPSVLICFIYVGILVEMLIIGYISNRYATGILVAYYMGEVFMRAGNHVMGGSAHVVAVTDAAIREWVPKKLGQKNKCMNLELLPSHHTVMDKLFQHNTGAISLTDFDLMMLEELTGDGEVMVPVDTSGSIEKRMKAFFLWFFSFFTRQTNACARSFKGEDTPDSIGVFDFVWLYNADGAPKPVDLMQDLPGCKILPRCVSRICLWNGTSVSPEEATADIEAPPQLTPSKR